MAVTVQVAVNNATFHFDKLYSYTLPAHLEENMFVGSMVLVPFGRGSAARMGVVLGITPNDAPAKPLKAIYDAAPEKAVLSDELLKLVCFLKERTFCTYYEAVKAIIPYGAQYKAVNSTVPHLQKQLVRHTERVYTALPYTGKATAQQQVILEYIGQRTVPESELEAAGLSLASVKTLCKNDALQMETRDKTLTLYADVPYARETLELSCAQQAVYNRLASMLEAAVPRAALLHGVTGSGKTLIFLKLIEKAVEQMHKTALIMVPEIMLTPQMILRLKANFGSRVAVQHSALNHTERLLQWQQIQNGEVDIVVGTRSAVFAPLQNIGLIVLDEEQEHTYHSESAPRYSAHDVAKQRAADHGALLLMASATPSTESYYAAKHGRYNLLELDERYNQLPLPDVQMVDMRKELADGNVGSISRTLAVEITKNIENRQQTILLLNRRGYKTVGMCKKCSHVLKCTACSVPMVYHKQDNKLLCHYCGKALQPVPSQCPECGGDIRYTGFGTQRVEEELAELFPTARILRMDMDSTSRKNAREEMLQQFACGEYDIMLGTQMVAKGLDFAKVSLVGVLGIDQLLFAQGYKAFENVFSLITQVVGRSGRAGIAGRALIQTVDPQHPVLLLAAKQDYKAFYEQEIAFRKLNLYPPFCTVCMVSFAGEKEQGVQQAAFLFAQQLRAYAEKKCDIPLRILGPVPMHVAMVNNKYRYVLTVKCKNNKAFRALMAQTLAAYNEQGMPAKASVSVDFHSDADI